MAFFFGAASSLYRGELFIIFSQPERMFRFERCRRCTFCSRGVRPDLPEGMHENDDKVLCLPCGICECKLGMHEIVDLQAPLAVIPSAAAPPPVVQAPTPVSLVTAVADDALAASVPHKDPATSKFDLVQKLYTELQNRNNSSGKASMEEFDVKACKARQNAAKSFSAAKKAASSEVCNLID